MSRSARDPETWRGSNPEALAEILADTEGLAQAIATRKRILDRIRDGKK